MRRHILTFALFIVVMFPAAVPAQDSPLMWLGEYINFSEIHILKPSFSRYTEKDLENFRRKLQTLRGERASGEWEGRYVSGGNDGVGVSVLDLSFRSGFSQFYIDTCYPELQEVNYGSALETPDTVEFVPEVPMDSPRKVATSRFVKVTWGKHLYLVDEKVLGVWAEKAVGRYVPPDNGDEADWTNFWLAGDYDAPYEGAPQLPTRFKHLERGRIQAEILQVHSRRIENEFSDNVSFHGGESAVYRVRINRGSRSGVRKGMRLLLDGTDEELTVLKVAPNSSEASIVRATNEGTRRDHCLSADAEVITCPVIKPGVKTSTILGRFFF